MQGNTDRDGESSWTHSSHLSPNNTGDEEDAETNLKSLHLNSPLLRTPEEGKAKAQRRKLRPIPASARALSTIRE